MSAGTSGQEEEHCLGAQFLLLIPLQRGGTPNRAIKPADQPPLPEHSCGLNEMVMPLAFKPFHKQPG